MEKDKNRMADVYSRPSLSVNKLPAKHVHLEDRIGDMEVIYVCMKT